jgi:geranylgeranyl reductase family protein
MTDVLVVGAGPAGATAARALALAGARVRLLDRARFPRNKPCGGAISVRAIGRFPYLATALESIETHWLSRLHLEGPAGRGVEIASEGPAALMIRRVDFDAALVKLAVDAGAELIEDVEITQATEQADTVALVARDGRQFHSPVVVAADGVYSVIARRLGLNPGWPSTDIALDMMEETPNESLAPVDPSTLWVSYGYRGSEGYAYVFPKTSHVNVGVGFVLDHYRTRVQTAPYDVQVKFIDSLRRIGVLRGRSKREHFTPYQVPVGGTLGRTATRRVLLAGDAGGFVNGITAEGIYYAMVSGELAARAIADSGPDSYPELWTREIGRELADAVLVQRELLTAPARIDGIVAGAPSMRRLTDVLLRYIQGDVSYERARWRLMMSVPFAAVRLFLRHLRGSDRERPASVGAGPRPLTVENLAASGSRSMKTTIRVDE